MNFKKLLTGGAVGALFLGVVAVSAFAAGPNACATIQSGTIVDSTGGQVTVGQDQWGYNYQAHSFNGYFDNYLRPSTPVTNGDHLSMKWNDAWLSNQDCNGDHLLDRHYGSNSYIGSGAWLTNEMHGVVDGKTWTYFAKIIAKPSSTFDCTSIDGYEIWNDFCVTQEVNGGNPTLNESTGGNGIVTHAIPTGLGGW